jgi:hypothetical protein
MAKPLSPEVFPKILVRYVPQGAVHAALDAVLPLEITGDDRKHFIERLRPEALNDLPRRMEALTAELDSRKLLKRFATTLLRALPTDWRLEGILTEKLQIDAEGNIDLGQMHSLRTRRLPFVNTKTYGDFVVSVRNRVCAIWIKPSDNLQGRFTGTGFLVAPDLIMTAHHVFKNAGALHTVPKLDSSDDGSIETIDRERPGAVVKCVFDYWMSIHEDEIENSYTSDVTVVDVVPEWLVWYRDKHPADGVSHEFSADPDIRNRLDTAIIRLARPIGAEAFRSGGGRMRGWVELPNGQMEPIVPDDPIAILQHPGGGPQGMDKGLLVDIDGSYTRIWYTTEAAGGSSGSPCFNTEATIIGFHNAGKPSSYVGHTQHCNQGVSIGHVAAALPPNIVQRSRSGLTSESALWSLSDDRDNPVPVLGRSEFKSAVVEMFRPQSDKRVLVVDEAQEVAAIGKSGKSFSAGILKAIARDRPGLVLDFSASELAQFSPDGFLDELCRRIGIVLSPLWPKPQKPTEERQVTRWWSSDLPDWFGQLIEERAISGPTAAEEAVSDGEAAPAARRELIIKEPVWIVIDDIHKWPPMGGMKELLAGMMAVTDTQPVLRPGLKALRWLVIGHVPDFVRERSIEYFPDTVSQDKVGKKEWVDCLRDCFFSSGKSDRFNPSVAEGFYELCLIWKKDSITPENRLSVIASAIPEVIPRFPA